MIKGKTVLVFGASGFIGGHLLRRLAQDGAAKLVGVDLVPPKSPVEGVEYRVGDVRDLSAFDLVEPVDLIVNLAAVHTTPGHPTEAYYETNILGAVEVCALARRKQVRDVIFTSSISVYGPGEETKSESSRPAPQSAYGWSKMMAERIHKSWVAEDEHNRLVICRPAVVFGAREGGNFTRLAKLMKKGFFIYPGRKDTIKGCIYVKDLVAALLFAWEQPERHVLFNASYPDRYTIEQIVETFRAGPFPTARTYLLPRWLITVAAALLRPFSIVGLGIHPDRVTKLVKSTDIEPAWLKAKGWIKTGRLPEALSDWGKDTDGTFS